MAKDEQQSSHETFRPKDEIDDLFASANPNPERIGCPPVAALQELARKHRAIDDPLYSHLTKCSPCYRQFRQFQQKASNPNRWRLPVAIAAAVVVAIAAGTILWQKPDAGVPREGQPARIMAKVELDLRPFSVTRSDSGSDKTTYVRLTRSEMFAEMILPVGSEAGQYEIRLLDEGLQSRAESRGEARIQNGDTRVRATLDVRNVPQGSYQLALRREGESWRMYPARVE